MKMLLCMISLVLLAVKATTDLDISLWLCFAPLFLVMFWSVLRFIAGWLFLLGMILLLGAAAKERDRRYHHPFHIPDNK